MILRLRPKHYRADFIIRRFDHAAPANNFWTQIKSSLRQIVNPHTFDWLVPLRYLRFKAGKLLVWMPREEWRHPALKLREQIFAAIRDLALPVTQVQFVTDEQVPELR
jgi:hypothetical protein